MWRPETAHGIAALMHIVSGSLFAGLSNKRGSDWDAYMHVNVWSNVTNSTPTADNVCGEQFKCQLMDASVRDNPSLQYSFDPVLFCALFAFWSAMCHIIVLVGTMRLGREVAKSKTSKKLGFADNDNATVKPDPAGGGLDVDTLRTVRALDYAVSAPLMLVVVAWLCGSNDYGQLITAAVAMSAVVIIDYLGSVSGKPVLERRAYALGVVIYAALWTPIMMNFFNAKEGLMSGAHKLPAAPDFVTIIVFGLFGSFSSFALMRLWVLASSKGAKCCGSVDPSDKNTEDMLFVVLSLTAKVQLHWMLYFSVFRDMTVDSDVQVARDDDEINNTLFIVIGSVTAGGIAFAVAALKG